jgi:hypothetical protein
VGLGPGGQKCPLSFLYPLGGRVRGKEGGRKDERKEGRERGSAREREGKVRGRKEYEKNKGEERQSRESKYKSREWRKSIHAPLPLFSSVSTSVFTTLLTVLPIKRQIIFFSKESSWNLSANTYHTHTE